jgi:hypothetical protein
MDMAEKNILYRVLFIQNTKIYEVYAKYIIEESLAGFIELEELVFSNPSSILVDPAEERLKNEFADVASVHVPLHVILRIDEVKKVGTAKVYNSVGQTAVSVSDNMIKMPYAAQSTDEKEK